MEIARLFGVMPHTLLRLPLSEFRLLVKYYNQVRSATEKISGIKPEDTVVE